MMIRPTRALIDTDALLHNLGVIRRSLRGSARVIGVVKADCYGHGASICVPVLQQGGVDIFAVATIEEAANLRQIGVEEQIVVMAPPLEGQYGDFIRLEAEPFVSNRLSAERLSTAAQALGRDARCHLFVDTGMGRDGIAPSDALDLLQTITRMPGLRTVGLASHFATSDEPGDEWSRRQLAIFEGVLRDATSRGYAFDLVHLANSGGILNIPQSHFTAVRPGLSLYGYHPTRSLHGSSDLRPVLSLRTVIGNITTYHAGVPISYGRRWWTDRRTRIASLPIGYADGFFRGLTNRMQVIVGGKRMPQVGTVCMDEVMIDLGPDTQTLIGDEVVIIGRMGAEAIDAWEVAELIGTIPYEICTSISRRVPRISLHCDPDASGTAN